MGTFRTPSAARSSSSTLWRTLNAGCFATLACIGIVIWDADSLLQLAIRRESAIGLSAASGMAVVVVATIAAALAIVVFGAAIRRGLDRYADRPAETSAAIVWVSAGCVTISAGSYVALAWASQPKGAMSEPRAAVLCVVALSAAVWIALRPRMIEALQKSLQRRHGWAWLGSAGGVIAWFGLGVYTAVPILLQLELRPLGSWLLVVGVGLLGACIPRPSAPRWRRGIRGTLGVVAIATWLLGGAAVARMSLVDMPKNLSLALELRATSTSWLVAVVRSRGYERIRPAEPRADVSAVCWPGAPPPSLDTLEHAATGDDIVFITVDALRWDHMGLSGYARPTTPNIDRHAEQALVFERAHSLSGTTRQTFRGLFTGVYASLVHEVRGRSNNGFGFTPAQVTLAEMLQHAGYETIAYSAVSQIFSAPHGALDGFSEIDETPTKVRDERVHSTDYIVDRILERLARPHGKAGRFVWTHLMAPHHPYPPGPKPVHFAEGEEAAYDAAIHFTDREMGRLLDWARAPERAKRTWIILTADHGEAWGEHGEAGHGRGVYQEHIHVPLIIWGPTVKPRRVSSTVSQIHIARTILDAAGVTPPDALCGVSLIPVARGAASPDEPVYAASIPDFGRSHFRAAFIRGDMKTQIRPVLGTRELYDLKSDPAEEHNLAVEHPELLDGELDAMRKFYLAHGLNLRSYGL